MKMRSLVCLVAASLVFFWHTADAASLRAAPQAAGKKVAEAVAKPAAKASPVASVKAALTKEASASPAGNAAVEAVLKAVQASQDSKSQQLPPAAPQQPTQRAKLDVGFGDFEKRLTAEIGQKLLRTASGTAWTSDMRAAFEKNVTDALRDSLKTILSPVKQSIGKTWMALPQDAQKNEYVSQLKSSFVSVFDGSFNTFSSHLDMSLKRVGTLSANKRFNSTKLLEKAETTLEDNLLSEHCYEVDAKKSLKNLKKPANATEIRADKKKFCIQSVIGALAHRLNDTQSLISMSMRFEAGAMSFAQKKPKAKVLM